MVMPHEKANLTMKAERFLCDLCLNEGAMYSICGEKNPTLCRMVKRKVCSLRARRIFRFI